jgi:hypothetical protein
MPSDVYGMPVEHSLATSLHVADVRGMGCNSPSLFDIVDCPLLAHATVRMMAVRVDGGL